MGIKIKRYPVIEKRYGMRGCGDTDGGIPIQSSLLPMQYQYQKEPITTEG